MKAQTTLLLHVHFPTCATCCAVLCRALSSSSSPCVVPNERLYDSDAASAGHAQGTMPMRESMRGTYAESSGASLVHCICYCMLTSIDARFDEHYNPERSGAALVHYIVPHKRLYVSDADSDGHAQATLPMHNSVPGTYAESSVASLLNCICYCMLTSKIRDLMSIIIQSAQEQL